MQHQDGRGVILARAVTAAAVTLAVAAGAHVLGGGSGAPGPVLGAAGAFLLLGAVPLARGGLRPLPLLAYSALAQLALHTVLAWLHPSTGAHVAVVGHHGVEQATIAAGHANHALAPMLLAHVLGTVVGVVLASGADRAATAVAARWRLALVVDAPAARPAVRALAAAPAAPAVRPSALLEHVLARRGPPAPLAA